jgi:hypothetical protein
MNHNNPFSMRGVLCFIVAGILFVRSPTEGNAAGRFSDAGDRTGAVNDQRIRRKLERMPPASLIQVQLRSDERIRGRIVKVAGSAFTLQTEKKDVASTRTIAFADVESVKRAGGHKKLIIGLVLVGVATAIILAVSVSRSLDNWHF